MNYVSRIIRNFFIKLHFLQFYAFSFIIADSYNY